LRVEITPNPENHFPYGYFSDRGAKDFTERLLPAIDDTMPLAAIPFPRVVEIISVRGKAAIQDNSRSHGIIDHRG
jgi:hypothetical protein